MNGKNRRVLWATLIVMVVLFSGLAAFSGSASAATATRATEEDTLYIAMQADMPNLNYFDPTTNTVWKSNVIGWMFDTLGGYTPDFTIYYSMAESWETDATGFNVTVYLRQGMTFHDGTPVTAKDVVFTYQVLYWNQLFKSNLESLYWDSPSWDRWDGNGVSHIGVEAIDDYTVVFHINPNRPDPLFYYVTINMPIIPEHIWNPDHVVAAGPGDSDDMTLDTTWSDETTYQTTISCGPWKFVEWQRGQYAVIAPYEGYYGKDLTISWQGKEWPRFPQTVKKIVFKIYSSLDTATLALKSGEVHFIAWSITPSYYNTLKTDPNIGFEFSDDQGFFYLAFNMRKAPMNDLDFRVAVSHCIDKDFIVTTLMGGYGSKGTVPISITNPRYVNTSAQPPEFDLDKAVQVLDNAGYVDVDGDGWRDAPDGSPIKLSILTPPKDYDPIRADAGIMISSNLKSIGLNVDSIPTSFDTIVSKVFVQVDFQMYILGWAVGSFPETYLYDFFHSSQAAPAGYNSPGYSNPKVDELLEAIATEMDDEKRIQMIKDVEGILVHDLPYNVLFYRKNIETYYKAEWVGWISAYGTIFNGFSLNSLRHPEQVIGGEDTTTTTQLATGGTLAVENGVTYFVYPNGSRVAVDYVNYDGLKIGIYGPEKVLSGESARFFVVATDMYGKPYAGLELNVSVQIGNEVTWYNVTTGDDGQAAVDYTVPYARYDRLTVSATGGARVVMPDSSDPGYYVLLDVSTTASKDVPIEFVKRVIKMKAWSENAIITPGAQTTIHVVVTDQNGEPVSGVGVGIYTETLYGSVDNPSKVTDANGEVTFTYTAPSSSMITNRHLAEQIKLYLEETGIVNKTVVTETHKMTLIVGVINDAPSEWYQVDIINVEKWVIAAGESTNITVKVTDINGNPVADEPVNVKVGHSEMTDFDNWVATFFEDTTNVSWPTSVTTGADGTAVIKIDALANANIAEFVEVTLNRAYSTRDSVSIYVGNETGVASLGAYVGMYAVNVSYSIDPTGVGYNTALNISIDVYDGGIPAPNVEGWIWVRFTDFGLPLSEDEMDIYVWWAGGLIYFMTDGNGHAEIPVTTVPLISDVAAECVVWVDTFGWGTSDSIWEGLPLEYPVGASAIDSFVLTRARTPLVISSYEFSTEVLTYETPMSTLTMTVEDVDGPVDGATVSIGYAVGSYEYYADLTTSGGVASLEIAPPAVSGDTGVMISAQLFSVDGAMDQVFDYVLPYVTVTAEEKNTLYVEVVSIANGYVDANGTTTVEVKVLDYYGTPVPNAMVVISTPTGAVNATTDDSGMAVLTVQVPNSEYTQIIPLEITAYNESRSGEASEILIVKGTKGTAVDELASTLETLKATQDDLNQTEADLAATQQELATTQGELEATKILLAGAEGMATLFMGLTVLFLLTTIVFLVLFLKKRSAPAAAAPEMPEETTEVTEETALEEETFEETTEEETTELEEEETSEEEVE